MWTKAFIIRMNQAAIACALAAATVAPADARPVTYRLHNASYTEGCFEICMCPIWYAPMTGRFRLQPLTITGTYDTYAVTDIHWLISGVGTHITGQGTLTRFNEFAALNRLELDLVIGTDAVTHFDSGMVPIGRPWPKINILVAQHGEPACYDVRLGVSARPLYADITQNGVVDIDDLLAVIRHWGECPRVADPCAGDITPEPTGDRSVNIDDLVAVLTEWD